MEAAAFTVVMTVWFVLLPVALVFADWRPRP